MVKKVEYQFKKDKNGHKYALKVNTSTGKKSRINYKLAKKRSNDNKYRRERVVIEKKLVEEGAGATYQQYRKQREQIQVESLYKAEKTGTEPLSPRRLKDISKRKAIKDQTGTATRLRFAWTYTVKLDEIIDQKTKKLIKVCDSPSFAAYGLKHNGDSFGRRRDAEGYHGFIGVCEKALNDILDNDLCTLDGGACVLYYDKASQEILKKFELGKGCGFSFDFKNYHEDENILKDVIRRQRHI